VSRSDYYASPFGAAYSAYMERPWLSTKISRLLWGGDTRRPPVPVLRGTQAPARWGVAEL